jgi:hypothetical protein
MDFQALRWSLESLKACSAIWIAVVEGFPWNQNLLYPSISPIYALSAILPKENYREEMIWSIIFKKRADQIALRHLYTFLFHIKRKSWRKAYHTIKFFDISDDNWRGKIIRLQRGELTGFHPGSPVNQGTRFRSRLLKFNN